MATHDNPFPCLIDQRDSRSDCPMNSINFAQINKLDRLMYNNGYPYGAWVVHTDKVALFPVCELVFFREEPTEAFLREQYGSHFLRFSHFSPHT
jgi:hypothetical protein